jgi:hydroxyethylthiazole kinase-like uncharacterized protein yjeF
MKIVNAAQMKKIDHTAINEYNIPGIILMENAGLSVLEEVLESLRSKENQKVAIVCGRGNNGGDGYVVARHLFNRGVDVEVFIIGSPEKIMGDAGINYNILRKLDVKISYLLKDEDLNRFRDSLAQCDIIVDSIFGTGLTRDVDELFKKVIHIMNGAQKGIISIDIPSGVGADDGRIYGAAIKANKTITFQLPKIGNYNYPGAEYTGELKIKDIGIPKEIIDKMDLKVNLITKEKIKSLLSLRKNDTHKGSYGKVCMIAGSLGMSGAAILACKSALRSGAGLLKIAIPQSINYILESVAVEAITVPLAESKKGAIESDSIKKIIELIKSSSVTAIGPGSGQSEAFKEILTTVLKHSAKPIVLDADALNVLAKNMELFDLLSVPAVMSPHVAEMSRLTGKNIEYINNNRIDVALEFAQKRNITVVLKGARTVVAGPRGEIFINQTGNPGMSTAGSGDVLTGVITGLIAQGIEPTQAAIAGVYIHGYAGDMAAERLGEYGLLAGDVLDEVPLAIKKLVCR